MRNMKEVIEIRNESISKIIGSINDEKFRNILLDNIYLQQLKSNAEKTIKDDAKWVLTDIGLYTLKKKKFTRDDVGHAVPAILSYIQKHNGSDIGTLSSELDLPKMYVSHSLKIMSGMYSEDMCPFKGRGFSCLTYKPGLVSMSKKSSGYQTKENDFYGSGGARYVNRLDGAGRGTIAIEA